jgi:hypothetical protein
MAQNGGDSPNSVTPIRPHIVPMMQEPNPQVVTLLRDLLQQAEDGMIQEVAIACYSADGRTMTINSGVVSITLIGAVTMLQHELTASWMMAGEPGQTS